MAQTEQLPGRWAFLAEHRIYRDISELALAGLAFLLYFIVRANVIDRPHVALDNAVRLIDVEKALGIFIEQRLQEHVLDVDLLVRFFNFVYFWLDFPLIVCLGVLMYFTRRRWYTFTRDAILFSGVVALVCYSLFPLAPPRLADIGIVDTLQLFSHASYQAQSTSFFVNPYAAMPSLHVGWAVLIAVGVALAYRKKRLVLLLALLHPIAQWSSTVATGNHYLLDGVGGLGAAALGLAFAAFMQARGYATLGRLLGWSEKQPASSGLVDVARSRAEYRWVE